MRQFLLDLKPGRTHGDAKRFSLIAAGDGAAIVVTQHDDRLSVQAGPKDTFAGHIEIVAIDQGVHDGFLSSFCSALELFDGKGHHAPDLDSLALARNDVRVGGVGCNEAHDAMELVEFFNSEFAVHQCHDDMAVSLADRFVYYQYIAIEYAGFAHRIAPHTQHEGCLRMLDQLLGQVNALCVEVICRRRKPGLHSITDQRQMKRICAEGNRRIADQSFKGVDGRAHPGKNSGHELQGKF